MCELDYKEDSVPKYSCFWTVVLEIFESPLEYKEIKPVDPKGINSDIQWKDWCWSWSSNTLVTDAKSWLIEKDPDTGKDWRQKEEKAAEDELVR